MQPGRRGKLWKSAGDSWEMLAHTLGDQIVTRELPFVKTMNILSWGMGDKN
jgi:hypothetical protein